MLTIALTTLRKEPRFDLFADSLAPQLARFAGFVEVIVVDGQLWYEQRRQEQLADAVRGRFPYRHVMPKPTLWQGPDRVTSMDYWDACSARNTAFAYANGSQVAFVDDCMVLGPRFVHRHLLADGNGQQPRALAGRYQSVKSVGVDGSNPDSTGMDSDHRVALTGGPVLPVPMPGAWLFGMNMSVPLGYALRVDGYDEYYSGQGGSEDGDFGVRLERAGCPMFYTADPDAAVYQVMDSHEAVCNYAGGDSIKTGRRPATKPKELVLKCDGKPHFANEKLIEVLGEDPKRFTPLGNVFNLFELRALVRQGLPFPVPKLPVVDWRDGQPLSEM